MAAGSSPESWVGQYVSVELIAEPGSETSIDILRGGGLESRLEGVSEYGVVLLMVRYDELEDKRIEYNRFYPWAQVRSMGLLEPQPESS
jgi:hypothetical protein